jgi:hypothetical protein
MMLFNIHNIDETGRDGARDESLSSPRYFINIIIVLYYINDYLQQI